MVAKQVYADDKGMFNGMKPTEKERHKALLKTLSEAGLKPEAPATAMAFKDSGRDVPPTHLLKRGNWSKKGAEVRPGFLSAFDDRIAESNLSADGMSSGRRTVLANWIADPKNPLTSRVIVSKGGARHVGRKDVAGADAFQQSRERLAGQTRTTRAGESSELGMKETVIETPLIGSGSQEEADRRVRELLDLGTSRGFLTYEELNEKLPDEVVSPGQARHAADEIDEMGIKLIDEQDIGEYIKAPKPPPSTARTKPAAGGKRPSEDRRGRRRRGDRPQPRRGAGRGVDQADRRPGADVPHPDGRDPPAHPRAGNRAWPRRSRSPASASAARCWSATTPCSAVVEMLKQVHDGDLPFDRTIKVSHDREPARRTQILSGCRTTCGTLDHADGAQPRRLRTRSREPSDEQDAGRPAAAIRRRRRRKAVKLRRGAVDPDPEGPAADEEAGADLRPDGRAGAAASKSCRGQDRAARRTGPSLREGAART